MKPSVFDAPGPLARRNARAIGALFILLCAGAAWFALRRFSHAGMLSAEVWAVLLNTDLQTLLAQGLTATFQVAMTAGALSLLAGIIIAAAQLLLENAAGRVVLRAWVEIFRCLPLLLLIYFVYFAAPVVGASVSTFWSLVAGLVLYNSAVIAVIVSAGIQALPPGQAEAGAAIGLRRHEIFTAIQLPQAVRAMLPALISQMVVLLKETSLGFIIGYTEFLRNARTAVEYLGNSYSLPVYTMMALVYIVINCLLSRAATLAQKKA
ncbi:amino acid ABC transporter permease [Acerihabitans sp.]|uniref:amino acid ABC transporter permease n=1 Tax=Acerihabitans sp. TaxID=2811394 RepID=UPI002ED8E39E